MILRLSIVIPCYNSRHTLQKLLDSLEGQRGDGDELIVVDDGSTDGSGALGKQKGATVLNTGGRKGPAFARNRGSEVAGGEVLVFLDADVIAGENLLAHIRRRFEVDENLSALSGLYHEQPANDGFFHLIKAAQCRVWFEGRSHFESLETACAAIRTHVFRKAGMFDENYSGADVEDYEFGYRLGTPIEIDHQMEVRHHFPDFWPNTKNYFKRAYHWAKLYHSRKKFDRVATTGTNALATVLAPISGIFFALSLILRNINLSYLYLFSFIVWVYFKWAVVRKIAEKRGWPDGIFALAYLFVGDFAAALGGFFGLARSLLRR